MCGIAGWVHWRRRLDREGPRVDKMGEAVACRGPDAQGLWLSPHVAFAHRRLIVVDPEGGAQPMEAEALDGRGRFVLVYNGELYNTDEVRADLESRGYRFWGHSDTEVVLKSYIEWGADSVRRFNGIFAYALYDEAAGRVVLVRDRLGVKPLFYALLDDGSLLFGSEVKALLAHDALPREVDAEGLAEIFAVGPARTPGVGVFRHVRELRPGWLAVFDPGGLSLRQYWKLESRPHEDDAATTIATVRRLLSDTVERQLVSDVGVSTFLSGGLDSSAVTAVAARVLAERGETLDTYAVDFVDQARYFRPNAFQHSLDAPWARLVSTHVGSRHHEVILDTPQLVDHLLGALDARDFPGMADIDVSLYLFCREIKREHTVALSGEAADEVFGGYPWCHRPDALAADTFPWARRLADRVGILSPELVAAIHPEEYVARRYREALAEVPRLPGETGPARRIREVLYLNLTRFLPTLLDRKDRMSMAFGLEVRVPFCDHRLVEYVWNIPWELKSYGNRPKGILREAARPWLPEAVVERVKTPYPTTHHPSYATSFAAWLTDILDDSTSPLRPLINVAVVRRLLNTDPAAWDLPWFGQMMGVPALFAYLIQCDAWLRTRRVHIVA
jgi:asparagine synthase (glutamine-hydrolysing)